MLNNRLCTVLILATSLWLTGCANEDFEDKYANLTEKQIMLQAKSNLDAGNYTAAANDLEAFDAHFPFGEDAEKSKLLTMYAYLQADKYLLAESTAERFIELYPLHPRVDYAYFVKGVAQYNQNLSRLMRYLPFGLENLDQSHNKNAFFTFDELIKKFPASKYANNARLRMTYIKNSLAGHELKIARYYAKQKAWVAVVNRATNIVANYSDTAAVKEALYLLSIGYDKLKMYTQSRDAVNILEYNYPGSIEQLRKIKYVKNT